MTMISCDECKKKISRRALLCPHCGAGVAPALAELVRTEVLNALQARAALRPEAADPFSERRRHRRIAHKTMVRVDGRIVMLFNVSRGGLMLSAPFQPRAGRVAIELDTGEATFALQGNVRWVSGRRSFSNLVDFGVEIVDPSSEYGEFVERLAAGE